MPGQGRKAQEAPGVKKGVSTSSSAGSFPQIPVTTEIQPVVSRPASLAHHHLSRTVTRLRRPALHPNPLVSTALRPRPFRDDRDSGSACRRMAASDRYMKVLHESREPGQDRKSTRLNSSHL